jgi:hypothetical protein
MRSKPRQHLPNVAKNVNQCIARCYELVALVCWVLLNLGEMRQVGMLRRYLVTDAKQLATLLCIAQTDAKATLWEPTRFFLDSKDPQLLRTCQDVLL